MRNGFFNLTLAWWPSYYFVGEIYIRFIRLCFNLSFISGYKYI